MSWLIKDIPRERKLFAIKNLLEQFSGRPEDLLISANAPSQLQVRRGCVLRDPVGDGMDYVVTMGVYVTSEAYFPPPVLGETEEGKS